MSQPTDSSFIERPLTSLARQVLSGSDEARRDYFAPDRYFVSYPEAEQVHKELEKILRQPRSRRPRNGLLTGSSTNGKTSILECFKARYPRNDNVDGDAAEIPVLLLDAPHDGKLGTLYRDMLFQLGAPANFPSANAPHLAYSSAVSRLARACKVQMIIIDEFHSLANVRDATTYSNGTLKYVKSIPNTLHIPIVLAGGLETTKINIDDQLGKRFWAAELPPWKEGERLGKYLTDLEANLPLKRPSALTNHENGIAKFLFSKSGNTIGNIMELINEVAHDAVGAEERITLPALERAVSFGIRKRLQDV
jgi:hypothetical protein